MICISDISVFKTKDGACIDTAQAMKFDVSPITSKTDGSAPENVWTWKRLCLLDAREVREYIPVIYPLAVHYFSSHVKLVDNTTCLRCPRRGFIRGAGGSGKRRRARTSMYGHV